MKFCPACGMALEAQDSTRLFNAKLKALAVKAAKMDAEDVAPLLIKLLHEISEVVKAAGYVVRTGGGTNPPVGKGNRYAVAWLQARPEGGSTWNTFGLHVAIDANEHPAIDVFLDGGPHGNNAPFGEDVDGAVKTLIAVLQQQR